MYFHLSGICKVCRCHYYSGKMADDEEYEEVVEVRFLKLLTLTRYLCGDSQSRVVKII